MIRRLMLTFGFLSLFAAFSIPAHAVAESTEDCAGEAAVGAIPAFDQCLDLSGSPEQDAECEKEAQKDVEKGVAACFDDLNDPGFPGSADLPTPICPGRQICLRSAAFGYALCLDAALFRQRACARRCYGHQDCLRSCDDAFDAVTSLCLVQALIAAQNCIDTVCPQI